MWPYNDAEAGWLTPPSRSANDNEAQRRHEPPLLAESAAPLVRKAMPDTAQK